MRILLHGYDTCCQNDSGGVQNRIRKIYSLLGEREVDVVLFNPFETKVKEFDILHIFMLSPETCSLMRVAKNNNVKIVLSSIVNTVGGWKIDFHRIICNKLPIITTYTLMYDAIHLADTIIVETETEGLFIYNHYKVNKEKIKVVPNGVDEPNGPYSDEVYKILGIKDRYILQVGRFDSNKNQKNVIKAMMHQNIHVVFVGGPDATHGNYYEYCKEIAANNKYIHFLGWLDKDSSLLRSAYQNADTFVLPSFSETFGLVALEAVAYGCKLTMSDTLPILKYKSMENITTFNPSDINDIRNVILDTYHKDRNEAEYQEIFNEFSWNKVIDSHISIYASLLK